MGLIVVTGASGHLGGRVAARLAGSAVRLVVRDAARAPQVAFTLARDHWATEQHIRAGGLPFTFLRDNLYADFLPFLVGADGVIRGPAGDGRAAVVAQDDIADAAVAVLRDPGGHAGRTYEMTGPAALSMTEVAATITEVTGRTVRYHDETVAEAFESRAKYAAAALARPSRRPGWPRTSRAGWPGRRRSASSRGSAPRNGRCC